MSLPADLHRFRLKIEGTLDAFLESRSPGLAGVNAWGRDMIPMLRPFLFGGKMLRGGLVLLAHHGFGGAAGGDALRAAAALELFHSAFLIHDDIMDDDPVRRGRPSIHVQYQTRAGRKGLSDPGAFGRAAALCAGDVLLFLGQELLASLRIAASVKTRVQWLVARELAHVGPAQIQDLHFAKASGRIRAADVIRLYTYKTARYTFSLPLSAGALLAGAGAKAIDDLTAVGSDLGLIFQIKDDEMGLFGSEKATGKPVGSDFGEGKKTLHYLFLKKALEGEAEPAILKSFGRRRPSIKTMEAVIALFRRKGVPEAVDAEVLRLARRCRARVLAARIPDGMKERLEELLAQGLGRTA